MSKQKNPFRQEDYNDTTEPLEAFDLPVYRPPVYNAGDLSPAAPTVPATQPIVLPRFPQGQVASPPQAAYPLHQPPQAYPVLPPPLKKYRGHPPGGSPPVYDPQPVRYQHRSRLPGLVRFFFVLVQLILLADVLCRLFGVQNTALWLTLLFAAGDLFVQPMRWVAANINLPILAGTPVLTYLEFLAAILVYGLFSRLLTLLLRALLN